MSIPRLITLLVLTIFCGTLALSAPASAQNKKSPNAAEKEAPKKNGKRNAKGKRVSTADEDKEKQDESSEDKKTAGDDKEPKENVGPEVSSKSVEPTVGPQPVGPQRGAAANGAEGAAQKPAPRAIALPDTPGDDLPSIARDQPGFIPDKSPEDLFHRPSGKTPRERYKSLLGHSNLPQADAPTIIGSHTETPSAGLMDNQARVVVPDGNIEGSVRDKQFKISGGVIIFYNDVEITAEEADIDEKNETAVLRDSVEIVDPQYSLKTNELRIFFGKKKFEALGFVQFVKNPKPGAEQPNLSLPKKDRLREHFSAQEFELYCNKLYYDWDSKELTALQSIRLEHPSFSGTMERLDYNDKSKTYAMEGGESGVALNVSDYNWIFTNQLVDSKDEKKVRAVTDSPTKINADKVTFSDETAIAQFYAKNGKQVTFDQTKRKVTASYIEVNDKTKDFYAEGSDSQPAVYDQTSGEWLIQSGMIAEQDASAELKDTLGKPLQAKAKTLTFNYDRKRLELRSAVEVKSADKLLTAGEMIQDETAKFFLVRDNVTIKTDANTEMRAAQVYVDTANDVYTFVGMVAGKGKGDALGLPSAQPGGGPGQPGSAQQPGAQAPAAAPGLFQEVR